MEPCPVCGIIFSLIDMNSEGIEEFFNKCHSPKDGRFCDDDGIPSGASRLEDSDGRESPPTGPVKRGNRGESLVDPHEGTQTIAGVRGYDARGKPVPGTDAWLESHGISREVYESRPYVKFEADRNDPALAEAHKDLPDAERFWKQKAVSEGQEGGIIMYKHPVPGSPYGEVAPQIRPNVEVVTNPAIRALKKTSLDNAKAKLESLKKATPEQVVKERKERVKQAELNLERVKQATPEKIRAEAVKKVSDAQDAVKVAKASGDDTKLAAARKDLIVAKRDALKDERRANNWLPEKELYDAETSVKYAKARLEKAKLDPKAALEADLKSQAAAVKRAENAYVKSAAKYVFSPGVTSARIDMNPDPQNIKNLTQGKGRIYFAMEGSIKNDAILTAVKREDPTAAVVNVPSVTLWQQKGIPADAAGEVKWFAQKYGKGREIVLIPDADGVTNPNVMSQAKALSAALSNFGGGKVIVAAPPLKRGTTRQVEDFDLPSGVGEHRKGVDDHLGAGRGTLGQLQFTKVNQLPSYSLSDFTKAGGATGVKLNKNSLKNTEDALAAISGIVGPEGSGRVSKKMLAQAANLPITSALDARTRLERLGIISVEHIWDSQALSRRKRIRNPDVTDDRVRELVKKRVIKEPRLDEPFVEVSLEESPVITIRNPRYRIKSEHVEVGSLSDLPTWKPPARYKGWTSPVTKRPDSTGLAAKVQESSQYNAQRNRRFQKPATVVEAPPGRRLVRTEEGAKRYGVPIGFPIPLSITAMEALLASEQIEEFYNTCHDPETGKFCPKHGRIHGKTAITKDAVGGWPAATGREVSKVSESDTVDGFKVKAVYEVTTGTGAKIRLYDQAGNAEKYAGDLLNNHARLHEMYPLQPPRHIVVTKPEGILRASKIPNNQTFSMVYHGDRYTYYNSNRLGFDTKRLREGYQMPSAKSGNTTNMSYVLTHEYGHHVDFSRHVDGNRYKSNALFRNKDFTKSLSRYGRTNSIEGYAESFAEWHHTNGQTKNPSARAMAISEGWHGTGVRASAEIFEEEPWRVLSMVQTNVVSFARQRDEEGLPVPGGIGVTDDFEGEPHILGDLEEVEPTEEELAEADKLMAEILGEDQ